MNDDNKPSRIPADFRRLLIDALMHLVLSPDAATALAEILSSLLVSGSQLDFLLNVFDPEIRRVYAAESIIVPFGEKVDLFFKLVGVGIKMGYAFLWEEELFPGDYLTSTVANVHSARYVASINELANQLIRYRQNQRYVVQNCIHTYPGDTTCRRQQPHSRWHEESANGLVDVFLLARELRQILLGESSSKTRSSQSQQGVVDGDAGGSELLACVEVHDICTSGFDGAFLDPLVSAMIDMCLSFIVDDWPESDMPGFYNCLWSALTVEQSNVNKSNEPSNVDSCLIQNGCIMFDDLGILFDPLKACLADGSAPCGAYIDSQLFLACADGCDQHDSLCFGSCLELHGNTSLFATTTLSCLQFLLANPNNDETLNKCQEGNLTVGSPTKLAKAVVQGLPQLATCVAAGGTCSSQHVSFISTLASTKACRQACLIHVNGVVPFPFGNSIPRPMSCAIDCYLQYTL